MTVPPKFSKKNKLIASLFEIVILEQAYKVQFICMYFETKF